MNNLNITLQETKNAFSYDLGRKKEKEFAKLESVGLTGLDIHGNPVNERTILEVLTVDFDYKTARVRNSNGLEWITKLENLVYCDVNGN